MKRAYQFLVILTALVFAAMGAVMSALPDIVPAHYNFAGEVAVSYTHLTLPTIGG